MNTINNTMETNNIKANCNTKAILCVETGKVFSNAKEVAKHFGDERTSNIHRVCRETHRTHRGMHFRYVGAPEMTTTATETNAETPTEREILIQPKSIIKGKGKRSNGNTNAVICMTTGEVFTSCTDAAEKIGTTVGHMSCVCRGHGHTAKGRKFCYVKDIDEHLGEVVDCIRKANMYDEAMTYEEKRKELISAIQHQKDMIVYFEEKLAEAHELLADAEKEMHDFMYR